MRSHRIPHGMNAAGFRLLVVLLVFQFGLTGEADARNCTAAEKTAADAQLWLNKRDKAASLARHLPWGVPGPSADLVLVQHDYVIGYSDNLLIPLWTAHRLEGLGLGKK